MAPMSSKHCWWIAPVVPPIQIEDCLPSYHICSFVILVSPTPPHNLFAIYMWVINFHLLLICHGNQKHNSGRSISAGGYKRIPPPSLPYTLPVKYPSYTSNTSPVPIYTEAVHQKYSLCKKRIPLKAWNTLIKMRLNILSFRWHIVIFITFGQRAGNAGRF